MQIWVDADACPKVIKEIIYRAADRTKVCAIFVANQGLYLPPSPYLKTLQVQQGFDVADQAIVKRLEVNDLVVTGDIPLAADVIAKGGHALNPRGELYSKDTIQGLLTMRDFMDNLRSSGIQTGGPPTFSQADRKAFASQLDRWLHTYGKPIDSSQPSTGITE